MRGFDEIQFGPGRTLNLRENLPTEGLAVRRAEGWLRQQQILGSQEVLVITGRGNQSLGGVPVIRGAVEKLLHALRRQGVVDSHAEHNPGAFVVRLAPIRAMVDAPRRHRDRGAPRPPQPSIAGLDPETMALLRHLAERALESLGVKPTTTSVEDEMHRQLRAIVPSIGRDPGEEALRAAFRIALAEYE